MFQKLQKNPLIICLITLLAVLLFFISYKSFHSQKLLNFNLKKPTTILILGSDQVYDWQKYGYAVKVKNSFRGRTDTIIILRFDPENKTLTGLNIPRDTKIFVNGKNPEKINYLNTIGGPTLVKRIIEDLLKIKIDHFVMVNSDSVKKIIDTVGGIEVEVPQNMHYKDNTDGIDLNLKAGKQVLNGQKAVWFARFRSTALGDIDRIQRQQILIHAIHKKLSDPTLIPRIPQIISMGLESIETDLEFSNIIQLGNFARNISKNNLIFATLPGTFSEPEHNTKIIKVHRERKENLEQQTTSPEETNPCTDCATYGDCEFYKCNNSSAITTTSPSAESTNEDYEVITTVQSPRFVSYWLPNVDETKELVKKLFKNNLNKKKYEQEKINLDASLIKIGIINASNNKKLTSDFLKKIREEGFQIVSVENKDFKLEKKSKIYFQKGNIEEAYFLRQELILPKDVEVLGGSLGSPLADLTLFLSQDLENFEVK